MGLLSILLKAVLPTWPRCCASEWQAMRYAVQGDGGLAVAWPEARMRLLVTGVLLVLGVGGCASLRAPQPSTEPGRSFAQRACAGCHAIGSVGESANADAPPFRTLFMRFPDAALDARLSLLARHGHVNMPPIYMTPDERRSVAAYIRSIAPPAGRTAPRAATPDVVRQLRSAASRVILPRKSGRG